jgi:hypothetical protein
MRGHLCPPALRLLQIYFAWLPSIKNVGSFVSVERKRAEHHGLDTARNIFALFCRRARLVWERAGLFLRERPREKSLCTRRLI